MALGSSGCFQTHASYDQQTILAVGVRYGETDNVLSATLTSIAELWRSGFELDLRRYFQTNQSASRVELPPYSFDRGHYSLDNCAAGPVSSHATAEPVPVGSSRLENSDAGSRRRCGVVEIRLAPARRTWFDDDSPEFCRSRR